MATHGTIAAFDLNAETRTSYSERLEHYFTANDISSTDKKRAILLTVCRSATYQLLIQPSKPSDKPYDKLIETLTRHYSPKPSPIIQRYKFHTRNRRPTESVATYIAELKALGQYCGFGDSLNDMIRDRIVCGVNGNRIQCRLLQESELTYKQAFDIAQAIETASKDIQDLLRPLPIKVYNTKNLNLPVTDAVVAIHLILVVFVLSNVIRLARKVTLPKFAVANPPVVIKTP